MLIRSRAIFPVSFFVRNAVALPRCPVQPVRPILRVSFICLSRSLRNSVDLSMCLHNYKAAGLWQGPHVVLYYLFLSRSLRKCETGRSVCLALYTHTHQTCVKVKDMRLCAHTHTHMHMHTHTHTSTHTRTHPPTHPHRDTNTPWIFDAL